MRNIGEIRDEGGLGWGGKGPCGEFQYWGGRSRMRGTGGPPDLTHRPQLCNGESIQQLGVGKHENR